MRKLTKVTEATFTELEMNCHFQISTILALSTRALVHIPITKRIYIKLFLSILRESPSVNKLRPWIHNPQEATAKATAKASASTNGYSERQALQPSHNKEH